MPPTRRVVLLGASNLTRSFATVIETIRLTWNEPIDVMVAMGHGRSYGKDSTVLGRKISGILPSSLWRDLEKRTPLPTFALATDIGNDLLYDVAIDQLFEWIESCLEHLNAVGAQTIVTELPMGSLATLSEARFRFFRRLLFPRSRLTLSTAMALAAETNERVRGLGAREEISIISASEAWYGLDPIHVRRRNWHVAWREITSPWRATSALCISARTSLWSAAYLKCLAPQERAIFGVKRYSAQPCGRLNDGTTISLY